MTDNAPNGTQAIDRAIDLLERVLVADAAPSFTELSADSGLARSTTSRLLTALERGGLLIKDADGAWLPGRLFELYAASRDGHDWLVGACHPELISLGEETGETIHLAVPRAGTAMHVDQVESTYLLGSRDWLGVDVPAHTSALGKVLFAWEALELPQGRLEQLTPSSVASGGELAATLRGIRRAGFATAVDELEIGLSAIAAPVFLDGRAVAAIGLSGPTSRLSPTFPATGPVVVAHARALSTRLGRIRKGAANPQKEGAA